ncbi:TriK protein [Vibrio nigripulchritudo FTn2]|nr:TriK protein [Vibrio nigripulchritudo FTn2]
MLTLWEVKLIEFAITIFYTLYKFTYYFGGVLSLISGLIVPTIYFDKPERSEDGTVTRRLLIVIAISLLIFGTLSNLVIPSLVFKIQSYYTSEPAKLSYSALAYTFIPLWFIGCFLHVYLRRKLAPLLNQILRGSTKKTEVSRDERTDIRTVREMLPETVDYNPFDYIDLKKGVFIGLDINQQPQYIPVSVFQTQHSDILGTTGAGKGVASGILLYQAIMLGEAVFVGDPKDDEWAPHVLKKACEDAGKPFYLIDLRKLEPQLDLLAGASPQDVEELLVAGFSLAEKGDNADFYRIDDRKAARKAPLLADENDLSSLENLFASDYVQGIKDDIKAFHGKMEEMSLIPAINAVGGVNFKEIFDKGGCCYIIGSMRNAKIISAQKMILIRLYQITEQRDRINSVPRPVCIFLPEFKYQISRAAMEGLGAIRDKGAHIILDHQSKADLKDCPADLDGEAVVGAVVENCKFKLIYRLQDPDTAAWVSEMTGTILVDDETRRVETTKYLTEKVEGERQIRSGERNLVDSNMLLSLPKRCGYIFTSTDIPKPTLMAPIPSRKADLETADKVVFSSSEEPENLEKPSADEAEVEETQDEPTWDDEPTDCEEPEQDQEQIASEEPEQEDGDASWDTEDEFSESEVQMESSMTEEEENAQLEEMLSKIEGNDDNETTK